MQRGKMVETDLLRIEMIKRGLDYKQLALKVQASPARVANVLCNNDHSWPLRAKLNQFFRRRIFSKPATARGGRVKLAVEAGAQAVET